MATTFRGYPIKFVDSIDWNLDAEGRYKKEYWGYIVVSKDGGCQVVNKEGYSANADVLPTMYDLFQEIDRLSKKIESQNRIDELLKLKEKFSVDEIIRLSEKGIL